MTPAGVLRRLVTLPYRLALRALRAAHRRLIVDPWRRLRPRLIRLAATRPRLAALYYCLFDRSFDREFRAVLQGKLTYEDRPAVGCGEPGNFRLRRNVHRLEKGLIMRPRRDVFALDYIQETIADFVRLVREDSTGDAPDPLVVWADDVLDRYFEACADHPLIDRMRAMYLEARPAGRAPTDAVPFPIDTSPSPVSIDELEALALRRRSARWYQQRPVPREIIDRAINIARYSPSACNRQPFEFRVIDDPELIRVAGSIPAGVKGFAENFPCFVALVGRLRAYANEYDRHLIYIDASLAAMAFVLGLEAQGVGSCCINWSDRADLERRMNHLLGLAPDERVVMCLSLGYVDPGGLVPYSQKKSLDQLRSYNNVPGSVPEAPSPGRSARKAPDPAPETAVLH